MSKHNLSREFKGIWIPKKIWLHPTLSLQAKCLWAEIDSLFDESHGGCFATDEYLTKFLGLKVSRLQEIMKELKDEGFLEKISYDGRIRIIKAVIPQENTTSGKPEVRVPENRKSEFRKTGIRGTPQPYIENKEENKEEIYSEASEVASDLASFFYENIKTIKPDFKKPNLQMWAIEMDKIIIQDGRKPELIKSVISKIRNDKFWKSKILNPSNLRKNFDRLELDMHQEKTENSFESNRALAESIVKQLNGKIGKGSISTGYNYIECVCGNKHLQILFDEKDFRGKLFNLLNSNNINIKERL